MVDKIKNWLKKHQNSITTVVGAGLIIGNAAFLYTGLTFEDASYSEIFNSLGAYVLSGGAFLSTIFGMVSLWWHKNIEDDTDQEEVGE